MLTEFALRPPLDERVVDRTEEDKQTSDFKQGRPRNEKGNLR
jgi:hypothetical protein